MNIKLPLWSVYLLVPAFIVLAGIPAIIRSEAPGILVLICIGFGLVTALISHGYWLLRCKVLKKLNRGEETLEQP